ncbi:TetR/AcrR family transcriptional regulator, partial [Streptomyces sp. NPDC096080]
LVAWRDEGVARLGERFARAVDEGDLPSGTDPLLLARYLMTVANGIAVQAVGGASSDELHRVAALALRNWPPR